MFYAFLQELILEFIICYFEQSWYVIDPILKTFNLNTLARRGHVSSNISLILSPPYQIVALLAQYVEQLSDRLMVAYSNHDRH